MKTIDVPGVGVVEFPDEMGDEEISSALKSQAPQSPPISTADPFAGVPRSGDERAAMEYARYGGGIQPGLQRLPVGRHTPEQLRSYQELAREEGKATDVGVTATDFAHGVVEKMTPSGLMNLPTRLLSMGKQAVGAEPEPDLFAPGKAFFPIPEPKGEGVMAGVGQLLVRNINALQTPEMAVTLPAAISPLGRLGFGLQIAQHLPESAETAGATLGDIEATPAEKVVAAGQPLVEGGMLGLLSKGPKGPVPYEKIPYSGSTLKMPKGAEPPSPGVRELMQEGVARPDAEALLSGKKTAKEVVAGNFKVTPSRTVGREQGHDEAFAEGYNQAIERLSGIVEKHQPKEGVPDASGKPKATEVHGDVREQPIPGQQTVPVEKGGEGVQPPGGGRAEGEAGQVPLTEPKPEHLQLYKPTSTKPSWTPEHFQSAGDNVYNPDWWVETFNKIGDPKYDGTGTSYQIGKFIRSLGDENGSRVIDALEQSRKKMEVEMKSGQKPGATKAQQDQAMKLGFGVIQLPREAWEAALNKGSAEGELPGTPIKRISPGSKSTPAAEAPIPGSPKQEALPEIESVTPLDSQTGKPLTAIEAMAQRGETGEPQPTTPTLTREEPKTTTENSIEVSDAGDITKASIPERAVQTLEEYANRARKRLEDKRRGGITMAMEGGMGPLHELPNIRDFAIIGASKIARGTLDFAKWSAEMIKEHGEQIRPYVAQIWDQAKTIINETVRGEETPKTEVQRIIERGAGIRGSKAAEELGLNIPAKKVEELTGVKKPAEKQITVGEKTALKEVLSKAEKAGEAGREAGRKEAHAEAKGVIAELREHLAESVSKVRALHEYFRGTEKGGQAGRKAATEELTRADRWLEADVNTIRDSLIKLVNKALPLEERGRFIQAITNATKRPDITTTEVTVGGKRQKINGKWVQTVPGEKISVSESLYRKAAEVAARIEYRADEVYKANTIQEIRDIAKKASDSPSVDVQYKALIQDAIKRLGFSKLSATREARLKGTKEFIQKNGAETLPDEVVSELDLLNKVPASELPIQVLEAIRDRVELLDKLGRLKVKTRQELWNAEKEHLTETMEGSESVKLEEHPELRPQPGEKSTFSLRLRNFINRKLNSVSNVDRGISPRDVLMDLMDGAKATYRGFMSRTFGGRIDSAFNRMLVRRDEIIEPIQKYGKEQKFNDQNYERIGAYAVMKQEGGRQRLLDNGADPTVLDRIESSMTPAELEMYRRMRTAMDSLLPEVQSLMRNLYNIDVKALKDYFPLQRDWRQFEPSKEAKPLKGEKGSEVEYDEFSAWKTLEQDYTPRPTTKAERGFTKERLPDAATPVKIHALDIFMRHIQDVAHLLETQRDLKILGEMVRSDEFAKQYGEVGQKYTLDWLDTVARQGGTEAFRRIAILDTLRRNTTLGVIGFRLSSQFVHLANIPLAMNQSGPGWYFKGAEAALSERGQAFVKKNFAETQARAGAEPAIEEAATARMLGIPIGKLAGPAFWIVRHIDRLNSQATALGIYQKLLADKGINPEMYDRIPIDEAARNEALIRTRRAVASPLPKDVPQALSRGAITGGNVSVGRALFQFQNVFLDQWSTIRHDLVRAGIQNKNPKYAAQTMAALAAMVLIETGIKFGFQELTHGVTNYQPKKPVDFEHKALHEALRRFPFMGNILAMSMYGESGVPAIDALVEVFRAGGSAATAKTPKGKEKAIIQAISGAAQTAGLAGASQVGEVVLKAHE